MEGHEHSVECVSEALVREYLSRKGLKVVLECLDQELASLEHCITNRAALISELHIEKLVKKNKAEASSFRTLLEIVVNNLLLSSRKKKHHDRITSGIHKLGLGDHDGVTASSPILCSNKLPLTNKAPPSHKVIQGKSPRRERLSTYHPTTSNLNDHQVTVKLADLDSPGKMDQSLKKVPRPLDTSTSSSSTFSNRRPTKEEDELQLYDLSDEEEDRQQPLVSSSRSLPTSRPDYIEPISTAHISDLRTLLFGNSSQTFGSEWREQNLVFNEHSEVGYGLVQKKGGPCGVLAVVQGFVLKELLFGSISGTLKNDLLRPSHQARREALARTIASILWKCGQKRHAIVALPADRVVTDSAHPQDGFLECLVLNHFNSFPSLLEYTSQVYLKQVEKPGCCVGFLYSALLSRGVAKIIKDMDDPKTSLIGRHGYCTQEMVNLLLIGQAVSNVFDGQMELNSGGQETTLLQGIPSISELGLLSLFDHYNSCKVGEHLKSPTFPIWIVLSESHFTVLFATSQEAPLSSTHFNLFYYDGLSHQSREIRLTINLGKYKKKEEDCHNEDLVPPLEHCIRTKWPTAHVDWNKSEPIL